MEPTVEGRVSTSTLREAVQASDLPLVRVLLRDHLAAFGSLNQPQDCEHSNSQVSPQRVRGVWGVGARGVCGRVHAQPAEQNATSFLLPSRLA